MPENQQPKFSDAALDEYRQVLSRYPTRQAALLPTLWIAQREFGWLSDETQDYVAQLMELPPAHVRAVVSFYTMLQLNQDAFVENLTEESTLKLIDELAARDN